MTNTTFANLPALPRLKRAPKPKTVLCGCGCGTLTARTFAPGHDAKLRAWALRVERKLVDPATLPGALADAIARLLAIGGGTVPAHAGAAKVSKTAKAVTTPVVASASVTDKKLAKKQARKAAKAIETVTA